jgi:hypothetical protein
MKNGLPSAATGASTLGRLLDIEQLTRTLAFLAGYRPAVFHAAPGDAACEAPRPPMDGRMAREDGPEPYCTVCGGPAGIFLGHGAGWHHFRAQDAGTGAAARPAEIYATDHTPAIGWRYTAPITAGATRRCGDTTI